MRIKNLKTKELRLDTVKKYVQSAYKEERKKAFISFDTITYDFIDYMNETLKKSKKKGIDFILSKTITLRVEK